MNDDQFLTSIGIGPKYPRFTLTDVGAGLTLIATIAWIATLFYILEHL